MGLHCNDMTAISADGHGGVGMNTLDYTKWERPNRSFREGYIRSLVYIVLW